MASARSFDPSLDQRDLRSIDRDQGEALGGGYSIL
jgi:hypothetical protein